MCLILKSLLCLVISAVPALAVFPEFKADAQTLFLLRVDPESRAFVDATGRVQPVVSGGEVVNDEAWGGPCLHLVDEKSGITVRDDGKLSLEGGVTIDVWARLDEPAPAKGSSLALKIGSFAWALPGGRLTTEWLTFPSEEIFTTGPKQFKYFPVGGDRINGLRIVPSGKWTRLTMAYDEALGMVTTRIDGVTDRFRFRHRGAEVMQSDVKKALTLFQEFKGMRIGSVHLRKGRPQLAAPTLEIFANALPYQDKVMFTFDHIDPALPLPLEAAIMREYPSGESEMLHTATLDSHARRDLLLDALPSWKGTLFTFHVSVSSAGRGILTKSLRVANLKPKGRVQLHSDGSMSREGKKFFPLLIYHALPEHFPVLAGLGFNAVANDFCLRRETRADRAAYTHALKETLDAAQQHGLGVLAIANTAFGNLHTIPAAKDHPALLGWYGADEPWGDITRLHESYNTIKLLAPDPPVFIVQNNLSRLQDTAPACDILAVDPYPVPNVSLRGVADATLAASRAVAGHKPVWTVLPQYATKVPTLDELRCMAWIAVASGANGLGIYSWEDQVRDAKTRALSGWFTPDHPQQIENLRTVLKELRAHETMLIAPAAAQQPQMQPANPALHVLMKEDKGKRWLIIANDSRRAESADLLLAAEGIAKPLAAGAPALQLKSGRIPLTLPALGVGVYELSAR